jgi:hypothetical protein
MARWNEKTSFLERAKERLIAGLLTMMFPTGTNKTITSSRERG